VDVKKKKKPAEMKLRLAEHHMSHF